MSCNLITGLVKVLMCSNQPQLHVAIADIDESKPPPPHVTAATEVFNNCSAGLTFSANVTATFRCRVNGGPWIVCEFSCTVL